MRPSFTAIQTAAFLQVCATTTIFELASLESQANLKIAASSRAVALAARFARARIYLARHRWSRRPHRCFLIWREHREAASLHHITERYGSLIQEVASFQPRDANLRKSLISARRP